MKLSLPLIYKKKDDKMEALLAQALAEIRCGRATAAEMLARYPEHQDELGKLLGLAEQLYSLPEVKPSPLLKAKVMALVREERTAQRRFNPFVALILPGKDEGSNVGGLISFPRQVGVRMTKIAAMAASLFMALALAGAGTVYASWESLPGDTLYSVKTAAQEARLALSFLKEGDEDRAQIYLWMADTRLSELDKATQTGRLDAAGELAQGYQSSLAKAVGLAQKEPASPLLSKVEEHRAKHVEVLKGVYDRVPVEAQGAIALALEASQKAILSSGSGQAPSSRPAGSGQVPASLGGPPQADQGDPIPSSRPAGAGQIPSSTSVGPGQAPEREAQAASSPSGVGTMPTEKGAAPSPTPLKGLPTPTPTAEPGRESPGRDGTTPPPPGPVEGKIEGSQGPVPPSQDSPPETERPTPTATPGPARPESAPADQEAEQKRVRAESTRGR